MKTNVSMSTDFLQETAARAPMYRRRSERSDGMGKPMIHNDLISESLHPEVSLIIPAYNEEGNIRKVIETVAEEMVALERDYEILIIDDGSSDNTVEEARSLIRQYPVRVICLSRNFGKENAITAGLRRAFGDAVIILDADLQEPVCYLKVFLEHWDEGYKMVFSVRANRDDETYIKRITSRLYYWALNKMVAVKIPPHGRDFRLLDRKVVNAICSLPERNRFMKGLYGWVGFKTKKIPIQIQPRCGGVSKFNAKRLFDLAVTGLTSFSDLPLRVWTGVGFCISIISIFYALFIVIRTMLFGSDVSGWPTITAAVFFLGGIQILSIGILGEYLSRVFTEVKSRPGHIVAEEYSYLEERD